MLSAGVIACGGAFAQSDSASRDSTPPPGGVAPAKKVDLNTADISALEAIPEIGSEFADAVVAGRPYKSVEDFGRVLRLNPEKMAALRPKVWASPVKPTAAPTTTPPTSTPSKPPRANDGQATPAQAVTERYQKKQSGSSTAAPKQK